MYESLYEQLEDSAAAKWLETLPQDIEKAFNQPHGDFPKWKQAVENLPPLNPSVIDLHEQVKIGCREDVEETTRKQLETDLKQLHPWRKGPIELFGVYIDTEWRSDWKWERLQDEITPLDGRMVLDVGCGNGYYGLRMLGKGAKLVVGIDPSLLYVMQYEAIRCYFPTTQAYVLPLGVQHLPEKLQGFDTVFSMGILYHQRSPLHHLQTLRDTLKPGGELVLETLIIPEDYGETLIPEKRYAKMRNVWSIPNCSTLESWLQQSGFKDVRQIDVTKTTIQEQRRTEWMTFHSLENFLNPEDYSQTIEGYPAPQRGILIAKAPT